MKQFIVAIIALQAAVIFASPHRQGRILATFEKEIKENTGAAVTKLSLIDSSVLGAKDQVVSFNQQTRQGGNALIDELGVLNAALVKDSDLLNAINNLRSVIQLSVSATTDPNSPSSFTQLFDKLNTVVDTNLDKIEDTLGYGDYPQPPRRN